MTRTRPHARNHHRSKPGLMRLALGLGLVLLLLVVSAHAAIGHAVSSDADHCALCVVAHSLAPLALLVAAGVLIRFQEPAPELLKVRAITRYWHPTLFNRPPPDSR